MGQTGKKRGGSEYVLLKTVQAAGVELNNLATYLCALGDDEEQEQIEIILQLFNARKRQILRKWGNNDVNRKA